LSRGGLARQIEAFSRVGGTGGMKNHVDPWGRGAAHTIGRFVVRATNSGERTGAANRGKGAGKKI